MNSAIKLVVFLVLLFGALGLAFVLWLAPSKNSLALERDASTPAKAADTPSNLPLSAQDQLADGSSASERASMPKEAKNASARPKAAADEQETEVVARIVDESLRPIADAWLRPEEQGSRSKKAGDAQSATRTLLEARSDRDGVVKLLWKGAISGNPARFLAGADGYGTIFPRATPKAGETLHLGDLTLKPGGSVIGLVVDKDQHPIADAEVVVSDEHSTWGSNDLEQLRARGPSTWLGAPQSKSGDDGRFEVGGVVAGMTRAWAHKEGMRWAVSEPIEVPARDSVRDVVLVIEDEDKADRELRDIEGTVVGPDDKPIPKAKMQVKQEREGSSWSSGAYAEADGRFRVHPQERGVKISIDFDDPEDRYSHAKLEDVKPGTKGIVVRLEEPKTLLLSVRDERGPVEDFRVSWGHDKWDRGGARLDKDEKHADGRLVLKVPLQGSFWYQVDSPGHMPERLEAIDGTRPPAELEAKLKSIAGIHGRVLVGQKPVQGAKLALFEQPQKTEIEMNGFTTLVNTNAEKTATSDSEGRFMLDLTRDGDFCIFADADGYARAQWGPTLLEAQQGAQELVIQLDAGGTLEGKVLMPPGRSPAGVIVGINRGDARPLTQAVGPDGAFRFERLTAGAWELKRCEELFHGPTSTSMSSGDDIKSREIRRDLTIAVGQTTHMDLDLRDAQPALLEIQLTNNSQPARAWSIVAWPKDKHTYTGSPPSAATDSSGHARLVVEDLGECTLTITPPAESGSEFKLSATVMLQRGPNNWSRDILTGRVEGTISGWQPDGRVRWSFGENGTPYFDQNLLLPDVAGHFVAPFVPAGKVDVLRSVPGAPAETWERLRSIDLAAGDSKTLDLP